MNGKPPPTDCSRGAAKPSANLVTKRDAKARRDLDRHRIETGDSDEISGC
jgi:hypothetical protein